jgi:hypothetical protein
LFGGAAGIFDFDYSKAVWFSPVLFLGEEEIEQVIKAMQSLI